MSRLPSEFTSSASFIWFTKIVVDGVAALKYIQRLSELVDVAASTVDEDESIIVAVH
jgi:hypothetical protein